MVGKAFNLCEIQANQGNVVRPSPKKKKMDWPYDDKLQMNLKPQISKLSKSQMKKEHVSGV